VPVARGVLLDASTTLSVTTTTTGATWQRGFLCAPTGELVVTTTTTNALWRDGFLRLPTGELVVTQTTTNAIWRDGFQRLITGELVVTQTTTGAINRDGFLRAPTGELVVNGLGAVLDYQQTVLAAAPARYYKLDETTGLPQDSSGNGQHATLLNGTAPTQNVASLLTSGVGKSTSWVGQTGDWTIPLLALDTRSFTITAIVKPTITGGTGTQAFFGAWLADTTRQSMHVGVINNGKWQFGYFGDDLQILSPAPVDSQVYHVAYVYDSVGDTSTLYLDGTSIGSNAAGPFSPTTPASVACTIGARKTGLDRWVGGLDELAIWQSVLAPATIAAHSAKSKS
jgi:hypothetical protein